MTLTKRTLAEFFGTFWLVFGGCGAAVLAAGFPTLGIGFAGVALAFGLTVLTMAFAIGHISGCHLNPAVSLGLVVGKRFPASEFLPYVVAQVAGAIAAAAVLFVIASGKPAFRRPRRLRFQRLRPAFPRRILSARLLRRRSRPDHVLPHRHHGRHRFPRPQRFCSHCHRPLPDADSPDRNPGHQRLRQPRP